MGNCNHYQGVKCWICEEQSAKIEALEAQVAELERELDAARVYRDTARLALEACAWYFNQRRYKVSPVSRDDEAIVYLLHDRKAGRYPILISFNDESHDWPSPYMAIKKAQALSAEATDDEESEAG